MMHKIILFKSVQNPNLSTPNRFNPLRAAGKNSNLILVAVINNNISRKHATDEITRHLDPSIQFPFIFFVFGIETIIEQFLTF